METLEASSELVTNLASGAPKPSTSVFELIADIAIRLASFALTIEDVAEVTINSASAARTTRSMVVIPPIGSIILRIDSYVRRCNRVWLYCLTYRQY